MKHTSVRQSVRGAQAMFFGNKHLVIDQEEVRDGETVTVAQMIIPVEELTKEEIQNIE